MICLILNYKLGITRSGEEVTEAQQACANRWVKLGVGLTRTDHKGNNRRNFSWERSHHRKGVVHS